MNCKCMLYAMALGVLGCAAMHAAVPSRPKIVLNRSRLREYVARFNADDQELYANIPNKKAFNFLERNIPLFECPDPDFERTYYFRWWTYRKHVKQTPDGWVITEFLPKVGWSGKYNTISCPAGHHYYEGRWLRNPAYLDDYSVFWLRKGGEPRRYSFWIADAFYARHLVTPNKDLLTELLPGLVKNYEAWETGWKWGRHHIGQRENGLFYTIDDRDGGEMSIGGHGFRPTLNSFMYGDAKAIAAISRMGGKAELAERFESKAARIKQLVQEKLWDEKSQFFKILPAKGAKLTVVRELYGYTPWYFNLPDPGYEAGWKELMNPKGFYAPYGPTFAEQRHPRFTISYQGHECQWNGPSWPLATCSVLTALANLLNNYDQNVIGKKDYFETLRIYTKSHALKREDGKVVPWIDENLNPFTGDWIARTRLKSWHNGTWSSAKGGKERGKDYNHSTYNDLIITGLVGLRPGADDVVEVNPLLPADTWDYFCLDNIAYHGHVLTILWDKDGSRYGKGKGLRVFADGEKIAAAATLQRVKGKLAPKAEAPTIRPSSFKTWKEYRMENGLVRLHVVPDIGGRVIQFALGEKEFFWVNPALEGKSSPQTGLDPDGGWMNYGGDKLWPAPQGWENDKQSPGPPDAVLDGRPYRAKVDKQSAAITLTSRNDPRSGIRFSRRIRLYPNSTRVSIEASMTNIDDKPRRWGIWAHTQLNAGMPGRDEHNRLMRAWCPLNPKSRFEKAYDVIFGAKDNPSFKPDTERGLMQVDYHYRVGKIGLDSHAGWVATVDGRKGDVFVQRFAYEPDKAYPDGSSVQFWHNGLGRIYAYNKWIDMPKTRAENPYVFESEVLSPFARLQPGEKYTWTYDWYACRIGGDYPVVNCNDTGLVSEPLQCRRDGGQMHLTGRFGVFHPGRLDWEARNATGKVLAVGPLETSVTPLKAVVLKHTINWPESAVRLDLVLPARQGEEGDQRIPLARVSLTTPQSFYQGE